VYALHWPLKLHRGKLVRLLLQAASNLVKYLQMDPIEGLHVKGRLLAFLVNIRQGWK
jgi:hypothetical protein